MTEEKINPTIVTEEAKKTLASSIKDPMTYEPGMDQLPSTMLEDVERLMKEFEMTSFRPMISEPSSRLRQGPTLKPWRKRPKPLGTAISAIVLLFLRPYI